MTVEFDGTFWDDRYRSKSAIWSGDPNPQLVHEVSALAAGSALDVGCGEGADAIWLAERGWQVTAVDISAVALARARAVEVSASVARRIEWLQADLMTWVPTAAHFDLVSAQFMHVPEAPRIALFRRLADAVKPRGSLFIVGHHPSDLQTTAPRPPRPDVFYTAAAVVALLDPNGWDVVVAAARERRTTDPAGRTIAIHDAVMLAHRRA